MKKATYALLLVLSFGVSSVFANSKQEQQQVLKQLKDDRKNTDLKNRVSEISESKAEAEAQRRKLAQYLKLLQIKRGKVRRTHKESALLYRNMVVKRGFADDKAKAVLAKAGYPVDKLPKLSKSSK